MPQLPECLPSIQEALGVVLQLPQAGHDVKCMHPNKDMCMSLSSKKKKWEKSHKQRHVYVLILYKKWKKKKKNQTYDRVKTS